MAENKTSGKQAKTTRALPRTNELGQFQTANNNPFPVPREYRGGLHEKIDILHPNKK